MPQQHRTRSLDLLDDRSTIEVLAITPKWSSGMGEKRWHVGRLCLMLLSICCDDPTVLCDRPDTGEKRSAFPSNVRCIQFKRGRAAVDVEGDEEPTGGTAYHGNAGEAWHS